MIVLFTLGDKECYIGAVYEENERGGPENGFTYGFCNKDKTHK
jgi:hypothetical protein